METHLACAAAIASINAIIDENLLEKAKENGENTQYNFEEQAKLYGIVEETVMMLGMELSIYIALKIANEAREQGVIINCSSRYCFEILTTTCN